MIDLLLQEIGEDKTENLSTTSLKFKRGVWDYFNTPTFADMSVMEFGTHKGQTTRILSNLFKHVYTVNIDEQSLVMARSLNADRENIVYIPYDLYANPPEDEITDDRIDVFFIDAGHNREHLVNDIARALYMNLGEDVYFIFDDYGMHQGVTIVVDKYINEGYLSVEAHVGHEKGYNFGGTPPRILYGPEGIICKLDKGKLYG